jgi:soluble lytic murein transglycosylase
VPLGAAQLRGLIDKFGGQTAVALAGYNAGPNAARRWLPAKAIDADIWVENIPYNETRAYVQRVLWHSIVFAWLRSGQPQRTESWLARITPDSESVVLGTL